MPKASFHDYDSSGICKKWALIMTDKNSVELLVMTMKQWIIRHIEKRTKPIEERMNDMEVRIRVLEELKDALIKESSIISKVWPDEDSFKGG